ncbi:MAG: hypothetical protein IJ769_12775, partial [Clostridia bacterium]|nr:hypothetical protein [Clostridia bacterium]
MGNGREWRAALAVMAAVAGSGYASGRELVLFFAQLGWAGWIGIPIASTVFALLVAVIGRCAQRTGATGFIGMYRRRFGERVGVVAGVLHALMLAVTAAVMLESAGEMGALTLPMKHGFLWGAGLALLIALLTSLLKQRPLPWMGLAALAAGLAFYAGLALDSRPPRLYLSGATALALEGNVVAAILLAVLYAAMNAGIVGGVIVRFGKDGVKPNRLGARCGALLCALLLCANAAILRGGRQLLAQAMPTVIMAARWGLAGFWMSSGFSFLCAASTLSAALGGLIDQMGEGKRQRR